MRKLLTFRIHSDMRHQRKNSITRQEIFSDDLQRAAETALTLRFCFFSHCSIRRSLVGARSSRQRNLIDCTARPVDRYNSASRHLIKITTGRQFRDQSTGLVTTISETPAFTFVLILIFLISFALSWGKLSELSSSHSGMRHQMKNSITRLDCFSRRFTEGVVKTVDYLSLPFSTVMSGRLFRP